MCGCDNGSAAYLAGASARARNPIICDGLMVHHQSMRARLSLPAHFEFAHAHTQGTRFADIVAASDRTLSSHRLRGLYTNFFAPQKRKRGINCYFDLAPNCFYLHRKRARENCQLTRAHKHQIRFAPEKFCDTS